jgi:hypothetical protein
MAAYLLIRVVLEDFFKAFHLYFDVSFSFSFTPPSYPIRRSAARIISGILTLTLYQRYLRQSHHPPLGLTPIEKRLSLEAEFSLL